MIKHSLASHSLGVVSYDDLEGDLRRDLEAICEQGITMESHAHFDHPGYKRGDSVADSGWIQAKCSCK